MKDDKNKDEASLSRETEKDEKLTAVDEPKLSTVLKWLDNFWYHYKAQVIIGAVVLVTVIISAVQFFNRDTYDHNILYAGPSGIAVMDRTNIEKSIAEIADDLNGDGEVKVTMSDVLMLSDKEYAEARARGVNLDDNFLSNSKREYSQHILGGNAVVCMLSPHVYGELVAAGGLMKISDVLGDVPDNSYGEYGIVLSKTEFGMCMNGVNMLPEDTILCVRKLSTSAKMKGEKKTQAAHDAGIKLFKAIIAYDDPEVNSYTETETSVEN